MSPKPQEVFSDWAGLELLNEKDTADQKGGASRGFAFLFLILGLIAAGYAEIYWDGATGINGAVGVGTSAYASTLYMRAVTLFLASIALGIISLNRPLFSNMRLFYRSIFDKSK